MAAFRRHAAARFPVPWLATIGLFVIWELACLAYQIPQSMPYFFGSLKVAITLAFIGSVLSETIAANSGVGHMMLTAQSKFEVPLVFACLIALAIQGVGMYAIMSWIEVRMTDWAHRSGFNR